MRIVIAGAGEIGCHLAKMLSMEYHEITVISPDEESLDILGSESDIVTVEGSPIYITATPADGTAAIEDAIKTLSFPNFFYCFHHSHHIFQWDICLYVVNGTKYKSSSLTKYFT